MITRHQRPIIIAAIDSAPKDKAKADYICDGIGDQVEIQYVIDTFQCRLEFKPGTYHISHPVSWPIVKED